MSVGRILGLFAGAATAIACFGAALAATPQPKAWTAPFAPFRIADNLYYVGSQDLAVFLAETRDGLALIDVGVPENAPMVLGNVRALGFDPKKIRLLLNTHAHFDHAGGLAAVKGETGALLAASAADAASMADGDAHDFYPGIPPFPKVVADRIVKDGEVVGLGGVNFTAHITAGHTQGCTTWTFPVKVDGKPRSAEVICSLTLLSGTKLVGPPAYPGIVADWTRTWQTLHGLPCEVFLGSHAQFFDMAAKRTRQIAARPTDPNPFLDPKGCTAFIAAREASFKAELARQQAR